ncbi:MAG: cysteine synthase A [Muribaculaceae bacterium]|nr:cysteine synthase A [Muribaculaceae bacterium]
MKIAKSLTELIGNTPLLEVSNIEKKYSLTARLLVKLESFNPGGSAKDRIALAMIDAAEASGTIKPGATIIEPTSGNTGVGLAWVASVRGYKLVLTMPDTMSVERRTLLQALGATLVLTPGSEGMSGAIRKAEELRDATPGSVILQQFDNPANPRAHYRTTGPEIWRDTDGQVDIVVAGVGTGGTISGTARYLKERKPSVIAIAVEPASSAVLEGKPAGPHKIQGIGANFIPANYDAEAIDRVMPVTDESAVAASRLLASTEGVMCGISSGAAFSAALDLAKDPSNAGKTIVAILPDTGERYLSTILYAFDTYPATL